MPGVGDEMPGVGDADVACLNAKAATIRRECVQVLWGAGGGHFGGSLSAVEILVALYFGVMRYDPGDPLRADRDRLVLSKGHACASYCVALAHAGFFPPSLLADFNRFGSRFGMHPDMRKIPGCDMSTGSLGHGLSVGVGMALAGRLDGRAYRTYVLLGDGECCEGSVWEAAMAGAHFRLDRLVAVVDRNGLSLDGPTEDVMALEPFAAKWRAFGWSVTEVDGHDVGALLSALRSVPPEPSRPSAVIAHTVKGKGVSFMEGAHEWHYAKIGDRQYEDALAELGQAGSAGEEEEAGEVSGSVNHTDAERNRGFDEGGLRQGAR